MVFALSPTAAFGENKTMLPGRSIFVQEYSQWILSETGTPGEKTFTGYFHLQKKVGDFARVFTDQFKKVEGGWVSYPIEGGSLPPTYGIQYGPFSGYDSFCISLSWTPGSIPIGIGYRYADSSTGVSSLLYGGNSASCFSINPDQAFYVFVFNPQGNQVNIDHFWGTISLRVF